MAHLLDPAGIADQAFGCILVALPVVDYILAVAVAACAVLPAFVPFAPAEVDSLVRWARQRSALGAFPYSLPEALLNLVDIDWEVHLLAQRHWLAA